MSWADDLGFPERELGTWADRARAIVDRQAGFQRGGPGAWMIVPQARGGRLEWLIGVGDSEGERQARETVQAFFGPATAVAQPGRAAIDPAADQDGRLYAAGVRQAVLLEPVASLGRFIDALELLAVVRGDEPSLSRPVAEPAAFLFRDFYLALENGDPDGSQRILDRLEAAGLVREENLRFLQVERLARLGRWPELGQLPWLPEVAAERRPRRVSEYLLETLWRRDFDEAAMMADPSAAIARFDALGYGTTYRSLIEAVDVPASIAGRRLVAVWCTTTKDAARRDRLLRAVSDAERAVLENLSAVDRPPLAPAVETVEAERPPLLRAKSAFDDGDFRGVVDIAEAGPRDAQLTTLAVRAAFEVGDATLAGRILALLEATDDGDLPATEGFRKQRRDVERLAANRCDRWSAWLRRVAGTEPWSDAAEVAHDHGRDWPRTEFNDEETVKQLAGHVLSSVEGVNAVQFRAALDQLCAVAGQVAATPTAAPYCDAVLLVLSDQTNSSGPVRDAFLTLTENLIDSGLDKARYSELLKVAEHLWKNASSYQAFGWALDLADILAARPCADPQARRQFIDAVASAAYSFAKRLEPDERTLFESIAEECQVPLALPPAARAVGDGGGGPSLWARLKGRTVGLYSLLDGAGPRFAAILKRLCPDVIVEHRDDEVSSTELQNLASSADYFIVDTRHATHAATESIDMVRPRRRQLFPRGGGVSSFVAAIRESLETTKM